MQRGDVLVETENRIYADKLYTTAIWTGGEHL